MKIETLKSEGYIVDGHILTVYVSATNQQEIQNALAGKEDINVYTDNEAVQQLVETFVGFKYIHSIAGTSAAGIYEVNISDVAPTLEYVITRKQEGIQAYDTSEEVNAFTLGDKNMWLDKETRVGLVNSINIEKAAGKQVTALWFDAVQYSIPIDMALQMLNSLELYALNCYNVTQSHIAAVKALDTIEKVEAYDYTVGYPDKLMFNLNS